MDELISVVVPIYNVEPFLNTCIDSILNQTYTNIEIILVASESTDRSVEIADAYLCRDSRVQVIHRPRLGLSDARNVGIGVALGKYICFIDSDDYISPEYVKTLYSLCKLYDCEIAQCDFFRISNNENDLIQNRENEIENKVNIFSNVEMCLNLYNSIAFPSVVAWTKLYKKTLFDSISYPVGQLHEDTATTHLLFFAAKRIVVTAQKLYYYRMREGSIMGVQWSEKNLIGLTYYEDRLKFFANNNIPILSAKAIRQCYSGARIYLNRAKTAYPEKTDLHCYLREKVMLYDKMMHENSSISVMAILFTKVTTTIQVVSPHLSIRLIDCWKYISKIIF